nr:hypothetical protein [Akkermansia muciniphila]
MSGPMMGHRSKAASALQRRISNNLRRILLTEQEILLSTSSGTGLMEGAVRSCTAKRAAIFSVGAFGDKWYKIATGNGVPSDIFKSELGQPLPRKWWMPPSPPANTTPFASRTMRRPPASRTRWRKLRKCLKNTRMSCGAWTP